MKSLLKRSIVAVSTGAFLGCVGLALSTGPAVQAAGGWVDLMQLPGNDTTAGGWRHFSETSPTALTNVWQWRDGVLICRGTPKGYLFLDRELKDFVLRFEWRWPGEKKPGNGGVLLRTAGPNKIWPRSLEAQLNAGQAGDFWALDAFGLDGPAERKQSLEHAQFGRLTHLRRTADLEKAPGQWNEYEIIARGPTVILRVNGEEVNRCTQSDVAAGRLCLTAEGDEIHFRNLRLLELPAADAAVVEPSAGAAFPRSRRLAGLRSIGDMPLRDTSVCRGPDGTWYLTGTVQPFWGYNEGITLWKSKDMASWTSLGMVWKYGSSPWHEPFLKAKKPLWAPEVHYLKGTFWLTYSMPGWDGTAKTSGSGLLKSASGKPEGPYVDMQPNERLGDEIDASLFEEDDGTVYFLWHSGKIARMKPDLSGLAEPYRWLKTAGSDPNPNHHSSLCAGIFGKDSFDHVGYEGMSIFKANGRYYLSCSENFDGRYSSTVTSSTNLLGPYGPRYEAIPHAGHNVFFRDAKNRWWSTYFGSDDLAPWQERPGVVPVQFDAEGRVKPAVASSLPE